MKEELKKLTIHASIDTPKIVFDPSTGLLSIEGKSFPPDVSQYYGKALDWLDEYLENPADKTIVDLKLDYFNTASSKIILDILYKFEELYDGGKEVIVNWHYPEDDEDMEETGIEYSEIVEVPFKQISYTFIME